MQTGILTGIHYPTGGYSTFTYTSNQYYNLDTLKQAGGLRVKTISSYDGISLTPIIKTYVYNTARANFQLNTGGYNISGDYFSTSQTHKDWELAGSPFVAGTAIVRSFNTNPHTDLEGYDGAIVVYPSVTEYTGTPGDNVGRTDYTFKDAADTLLDASMGGTQIFASAFYRRGQLQSKKEYIRKSDGTYQPVKKIYNAYTAFKPSWYPNVALAVFKTVYNDGAAGANPMFDLSGPGSYDDDRKTGNFIFNWYNISSDDNYLTGTATYTYDTNDPSKYSIDSTVYKYDNITHQQVTRTYHTDSRGNTLVARTKYPADYPTGNPVIDSMVNRNMQAEAVEKYDTLKNAASGINGVVSAQFNKFKTGGIAHTIVPSTISTLSVAQPLTSFSPSNVVSGSITADSHYVQMISFDDYDAKNNLTQYTPRNATPTAILWNYNFELPVAQIKNAPNYSTLVTSYAYTGFEADSKGGWTYSGAPLFDNTAPAGSYSYPLSAGAVTSGTIDNTRSYVLSYWSKTTAATVSYNGTGYSGTSLRSANGWTYFEHQLPITTSTPTISVSGSVTIDELRLYPGNAQMTTYNYDPSGLRSISDTKGANSYFEYDYLQRLKNIKDWQGNIVKNYGYHMYDMGVGNQAQTGKFTSVNCTGGSISDTLIYTVPANRYYGTSQASANADAAYDMNLNGQIKANATCACLVPFVLTNNLSPAVAHIQVTFTGASTYNVEFPATGSKTFGFPAGTYSVQIFPSGSFPNRKFTLGGRPSQTAPGYTFTGVSITLGSSESPLIVANP